MCTFCESCLGKKHNKNSQYNICYKCIKTFRIEYKEYIKHVSSSLSFSQYLKMALLSTNVKTVKKHKETQT
jgi:hypothetical protein